MKINGTPVESAALIGLEGRKGLMLWDAPEKLKAKG